MVPKQPDQIDPDSIVDHLYEIALDPETLTPFIDAWNAAGLDASTARLTMQTIDDFDNAYVAHLKRAEAFLARGATEGAGPDFDEMLSPFKDLAAFIVDTEMQVVAYNSGAAQAFGITGDSDLAGLGLDDDMFDALLTSLTGVFGGARADRLLRLQAPGSQGQALFQIHGVADGETAAPRHALIVTTQYHWQPALGDTLEEVFNLTPAEQTVVRALVEGRDAKSISAVRGTSEGTVRGQIKSILSKMNARSQSEVIRLVLSLRDVSRDARATGQASASATDSRGANWLDAEIWKPFRSLTMPDGRKMNYLDMGPATGAPILYTHMGYGMARWHGPMVKLAFQHGLRVIVPIRAGYGHSDNLNPKADVLAATRDDTQVLLTHLGIARLPYVTQGNDLIFGADYARHNPDQVSELIGICARPWLSGDQHYAAMGKWHRFFMSTAQHAPHLLKFTTKAAVAMAKRIGPVAFFRQVNQGSKADMAMLEDPELLPVLKANGELVVGKDTDLSQIYAMEMLVTERDWSEILIAARGTRTWCVNGGEDPATDIATIAAYREEYPWIDIEVIPNGGQMLIYQHYQSILPRLALAAKRAQIAGLG